MTASSVNLLHHNFTRTNNVLIVQKLMILSSIAYTKITEPCTCGEGFWLSVSAACIKLYLMHTTEPKFQGWNVSWVRARHKRFLWNFKLVTDARHGWKLDTPILWRWNSFSTCFLIKIVSMQGFRLCLRFVLCYIWDNMHAHFLCIHDCVQRPLHWMSLKFPMPSRASYAKGFWTFQYH